MNKAKINPPLTKNFPYGPSGRVSALTHKTEKSESQSVSSSTASSSSRSVPLSQNVESQRIDYHTAYSNAISTFVNSLHLERAWSTKNMATVYERKPCDTVYMFSSSCIEPEYIYVNQMDFGSVKFSYQDIPVKFTCAATINSNVDFYLSDCFEYYFSPTATVVEVGFKIVQKPRWSDKSRQLLSQRSYVSTYSIPHHVLDVIKFLYEDTNYYLEALYFYCRNRYLFLFTDDEDSFLMHLHQGPYRFVDLKRDRSKQNTSRLISLYKGVIHRVFCSGNEPVPDSPLPSDPPLFKTEDFELQGRSRQEHRFKEESSTPCSDNDIRFVLRIFGCHGSSKSLHKRFLSVLSDYNNESLFQSFMLDVPNTARVTCRKVMGTSKKRQHLNFLLTCQPQGPCNFFNLLSEVCTNATSSVSNLLSGFQGIAEAGEDYNRAKKALESISKEYLSADAFQSYGALYQMYRCKSILSLDFGIAFFMFSRTALFSKLVSLYPDVADLFSKGTSSLEKNFQSKWNWEENAHWVTNREPMGVSSSQFLDSSQRVSPFRDNEPQRISLDTSIHNDEEYTSQGDEPTENMLISKFRTVIHSIITMILNVAPSSSAALYAATAQAYTQFFSLGTKTLGSLFDLFETVASCYSLYLVTGNIADLFGVGRRHIYILGELREAVQFLSGIDPSGNIEDRPRMQKCLKLRDFIAKDQLIHRQAYSGTEVKLLISEFLPIMAQLDSKVPYVPYRTVGFMFIGAPGVGKTTFCQEMADMVAASQNVPPDQSSVLHFNTVTAFQDLPTIPLTIIVNDAGGIADEHTPYQNNLLVTLQSMVDSSAGYHVNAASLPDKARARASYRMVLVSMNASKINFSRVTEGNHDKLVRRYEVINVEYTQYAHNFCTLRPWIKVDHLFPGFRKNYFYKLKKEEYPDESLCFKFTVGRMRHDDKKEKVVNFTPVDDLREFTNWPECSLYLTKLYAERSKFVKSVVPVKRCEKCFNIHCDGIFCQQPLYESQGGKSSKPSNSHVGEGQSVDDFINSPVYPEHFVPEMETAPLSHPQKGSRVCCFRRKPTLTNKLEVPVPMTKPITNVPIEPPSPSIAQFLLRKCHLADAHFKSKKKFVSNAVIFTCMVIVFSQTAKFFSYSVQGIVSGDVVNVPGDKTPAPFVFKTEPLPWLGGNVQSNIENNNLPVGTRDSKGVENAMFGVLLTRETFLVPKHLFEENYPVEMTIRFSRDKGTTFLIDKTNVYRFPDRDCAVVWLPITIPVGLYGCWSNLSPTTSTSRSAVFNNVTVDISDSDGLSFYSSKAQGFKGLCGRSYISLDGVLVGFHTHGKTDGSLGTKGCYVSQEMLKAPRRFFEESGKTVIVFSQQSFSAPMRSLLSKSTPDVGEGQLKWLLPEFRSDGTFGDTGMDITYYGRISIGKANMTAKKTSLYPVFGPKLEEFTSKVYGKPASGKAVFNPVTGSWDSFFTKVMRGRGCSNYQDPYLSRAIDYLVAKVPLMPEGTPRVINLKTALAGVDGLTLMSGVKDNSGVGPVLKEMGVTKDSFIKKISDRQWELHPKVQERFDFLSKNLQEGNFLDQVVRGTLKDEVVADNKIARVFYVTCKVINVLTKCYARPICAWLLTHYKESGIVGAINPGGPQWGDLDSKHKAVGEMAIDADQKSMDIKQSRGMSLCEEYFSKMAIRQGMDVEDRILFQRLLRNMSYYFVDLNGYYFFFYSSLCSGYELTLAFNSIATNVLHIAWVMMRGAVLMIDIDLKTEVAESATGDDSDFSVSDRLVPLLDASTLQEYASRLGFIMTRGDKKEGPLQFRSRYSPDYLYLKRRRVYDDEGRCLAPIDFSSILRSLCFSTGNRTVQEENDRNLATMMSAEKELSLHGDEVYESYRPLFGAAGHKMKSRAYHMAQWDNETLKVWDGRPPASGLVGSSPVVASSVNEVESTSAMVTNVVETPTQPEYGFQGKSSYDQPFPTEINSSQQVVISQSNTDFPKIVDFDTPPTDVETGSNLFSQISTSPQADWFRIFTSQERLILTYTWTTISTSTTFRPWTSWYAIPTVSRLLDPFLGFRGTTHLRFSYGGNPKTVGSLLIFAVPDREGNAYQAGNPFTDSVTPLNILSPKLFSYRHIIIDASLACNCELSLPYYSQHDFAFGTTSTTAWSVVIMPVHTLVNIDGTTPANIKVDVFASFPDLQSRGLERQSKSGGKLSQMLDSLSAFIAPYHAAASQAAKLGGAIADAAGYGRPIEDVQDSMVMRTVGNMSLMTGAPDQVYHLSEGKGYTNETTHLPGEVMTDVYQLVRKKSVLYSNCGLSMFYPVTPCIAKSSTLLTPDIYPLPISVGTAMYKCWTGSIEVTLKIYSSALTRQRFIVNVYPLGNPVVGAVTNGTVISHIFEVMGSTEFTFLMPYWHSNKFLQTELVRVQENGTASTPTSTTPTFVINRLDGDFQPYIQAWVGAGPDFELALPDLGVLLPIYIEQGLSDSTFGPQQTSFQGLSKRSCFNYYAASDTTSVIPLPADGLIKFQVGPATAGNVTFSDQQWTFFTYIRSFCLGYSGGSVYRFVVGSYSSSIPLFQEAVTSVTQRDGLIGSIGLIGSTSLENNNLTGGSQVFTSPVLEVMVSDRNRTQYKPSGMTLLIDSTGNRAVVSVNRNTATGCGVQVHLSGGEDVLFSEYMPPTWNIILSE